MEAIRDAGVKIGVDPLGGASRALLGAASRERYGLDITVVNPTVDPPSRFMTVDHDGKIRMDCSSPYAMAGLRRSSRIEFDVAFGNDPDADRHGIVTPSARADESESLPGRRDPVPVHAPARVAARERPIGKTLV